jgi:hypothetical protein
MIVQEALEILHGDTREDALYQYDREDRPYILARAERMAIKALEEVEQYRALGTVEELKEAMEKRVAKKVIRQKGECYAKTMDGKEYHEIILVCPNCHRAIKRTEALDVHCKYCGQALKWGEEDD